MLFYLLCKIYKTLEPPYNKCDSKKLRRGTGFVFIYNAKKIDFKDVSGNPKRSKTFFAGEPFFTMLHRKAS